MELVYFWIEKFGDKNNQDINFNQNYTFKVEKQDEKYFLKMEENNNKIPDNYFGEKISNISCIIGNNGSGKTSLIKEILRLKSSEYRKQKKYILVFKENKEIGIETNIEKYILSESLESKFAVELRNNFVRYSKYIYFTNDITPMVESNILNVFDISLKNKLNNYSLNEEKNKLITGRDFINILHERNLENISKFIIDNGDTFIKKIPYTSLKEKLRKIKTEGVLVFTLKEQFSEYESTKNYKDIYKKINILLEKQEMDFKESFILNIWKYISDLIVTDIENKKISEEVIKQLGKRSKNDTLVDWLKNQLFTLKGLVKDYTDEMKKAKENKEKFSPSLAIERITFEEDYFLKILENIKEGYIVGNKYLEIPYQKNETFAKEISEERGIRYQFFKYTFKEGFSSGEFILLYLLKEIFDLKNKIDLNGGGKNIIFFLEELEGFLHPEWQRRAIELLEIVIDNCTWLKRRKAQIILSSHTPLLIGDIPKGNIKRIENFEIKDLTENPFGDNLLKIFKFQFNLESLFGEFTREKIKKYAKKLKENGQLLPEEKEEVQFLINNIEEPLIRSSLKELYEKTFSKEERIKFLEEEIKKLKEEKNVEVR